MLILTAKSLDHLQNILQLQHIIGTEQISFYLVPLIDSVASMDYCPCLRKS